MLNHYRSILRQNRKGFTLIELMVVLLIMAILLAIAIPIFLGVTGGANDRSTEGNQNTALTTAKSSAETNGQSYSAAGGGINITAATLGQNEPSLTFLSGATNVSGRISVWVSTDGNGIALASPSSNGGVCLWVIDNISFVTGNATTNGPYTRTTNGPGTATSAPTTTGTYYGVSPNGTTCNASSNSNFAPATWGTSFGAIGH